jgi:hypothetical protein
MYLLNSVALKLAGITRETPDPAGGVIVRDARGEPTGIVKDNAKDLVDRIIPDLSPAEADAAMREGVAHALSKGVAQVHNPEIDWKTYESVRRLRARGETDLRFYCFVPLSDWERMARIVAQEGRGDDWARWGAVKGLADGSLGSRTAVFREPYADAPGQRGVRVTGLADLKAWIAAAAPMACMWRPTPSAILPTTTCSTSTRRWLPRTGPATAASGSSMPSTWSRRRSRASRARR